MLTLPFPSSKGINVESARYAVRFLVGYFSSLAKNTMYLRQQEIFLNQKEYQFFTSWPARVIYVHLWSALLFHKPWILKGVLLVIYMQICWIVLKWITYIIDDPDLIKNVRYIRGWIRLFLKQGHQILNNHNAAQFVMAGTMLRTMPSGMSYMRAIVRYRTRQMNLKVVELLNEQTRSRPFRMTSVAENIRMKHRNARDAYLKSSSV